MRMPAALALLSVGRAIVLASATPGDRSKLAPSRGGTVVTVGAVAEHPAEHGRGVRIRVLDPRRIRWHAAAEHAERGEPLQLATLGGRGQLQLLDAEHRRVGGPVAFAALPERRHRVHLAVGVLDLQRRAHRKQLGVLAVRLPEIDRVVPLALSEVAEAARLDRIASGGEGLERDRPDREAPGIPVAVVDHLPIRQDQVAALLGAPAPQRMAHLVGHAAVRLPLAAGERAEIEDRRRPPGVRIRDRAGVWITARRDHNQQRGCLGRRHGDSLPR